MHLLSTYVLTIHVVNVCVLDKYVTRTCLLMTKFVPTAWSRLQPSVRGDVDAMRATPLAEFTIKARGSRPPHIQPKNGHHRGIGRAI